MNKNSLLSVIVIVYNEEKYIEQCIKSVINQTYRNLDIVIVDDGSSDQSSEICDKFLSLDNRIRVIHKQNGGSVSARKIGVLEAQGEYITYVDGDDWLLPDHYERIMAQADDSDIIAFGLTCVYNNKSEVMSNTAVNGIYEGERLRQLKTTALFSSETSNFGILPSMCSKICRTSLIKNNLINVSDDIRMGEDGACSFPSICDAQKITIDNSITSYMYRKTDAESMSSSYSYDEFKRIENLYHVLTKAFSDKDADYMFPQLSCYMAFLFRMEMVYELAYLSPLNLLTKVSHIKELRQLEWVKYVIKSIDKTKVDGDTRLFLKYVNCVPMLFYKWYIGRRFPGHDRFEKA